MLQLWQGTTGPQLLSTIEFSQCNRATMDSMAGCNCGTLPQLQHNFTLLLLLLLGAHTLFMCVGTKLHKL